MPLLLRYYEAVLARTSGVRQAALQRIDRFLIAFPI